MRDEHRQERLAEGLELSAESTAVGDGERAVDRHDSFVGLDEIGVDQRALRPRRMAVDARLGHHAAVSAGSPWRSTTRS